MAEPLPDVPVLTPEAGVGETELSYVPPAAPQVVVSEDRINILLLGIDRRGGKGWGYRTDTIIIVTVDQTNNTAGMLSIPRDLQLPIPGNGEDRINTANVWGYVNRLSRRRAGAAQADHRGQFRHSHRLLHHGRFSGV